MSIIFEVEDLLEASPATVSRCGMVFLEGKDLGWEPFINPWFSELTENINTEYHYDYFQDLFQELLQPILTFLFESDYIKHAFSTNE